MSVNGHSVRGGAMPATITTTQPTSLDLLRWPDLSLAAADRPLTDAETIEARAQYQRFMDVMQHNLAVLAIIEERCLAYERRQYRYLRAQAQIAIKRHRTAVLGRDGYVCGICGGDIAEGEVSIDHIIPITRGGDNDPTNLQPAHLSCNSRKGNRQGGNA